MGQQCHNIAIKLLDCINSKVCQIQEAVLDSSSHTQHWLGLWESAAKFLELVVFYSKWNNGTMQEAVRVQGSGHTA